jgi:signal transduction histidine kinase
LTAFVSTDLKRNEIKIPNHQGVAGWVFQHSLPLIVADAYRDERFYPDVDEQTGFRTRNMICVPLINRKKETIGTLQVLNKNSGDFSDDDREVLIYLANYVTVAIENSRLYGELKAADRAKERVISHLSHELKTPLSIISTAFRIIEKKGHQPDGDVIKKAAKRGRRSAARLMELQLKVDDIIQLRQFEEKPRMLSIIEDAVDVLKELEDGNAGQYEKALGVIRNRIESIFAFEAPRVERIRVTDLIDEIINEELADGRRDYPQIRVDVETDPFLNADRRMLRTVLAGLLKNAVENTPDDGLIEIAARSSGTGLSIDVCDHGIGITVDNQQNIFGGFFHTLDTSYYTSKRPYDFNAGGAGLDLLRMKVFAERFGFSIGVDSTRCKFIPLDTDICAGKISACPFVKERSECLSSGGSTFSIKFANQ